MRAGLSLDGLNGGNPLGFLSAIGCFSVACDVWPEATLGWETRLGAWHPVLNACAQDVGQFIDKIDEGLARRPMDAFTVNKKLPYPVSDFRLALEGAQKEAFEGRRRNADVLCGLGDENYAEEGVFQETALRMVRSGDAAGQGLPAYAISIRASVTRDELRRALFSNWDYTDSAFSLRWDPIEDQSYALRFDNPSTSKDRNAPRTVNGANALALEALTLLPVFCMGRQARTTAFLIEKKPRSFTWPIWTGQVRLETVRALLGMASLLVAAPSEDTRQEWYRRGIAEVYRASIVAPNQYYRNFSPGVPL